MGIQHPTVRQIGKYLVLDVIGAGGMGIVYRAQDPTIGRTVAIKMLRARDLSGDSDTIDRFFLRELKSTGNLNHKNIVTVYDSGEHEGNPFLVMQYLEGDPISKIIAERRSIPLVDKLDVIVQVCDGLQYAHDRNIVHRDIKPANVILLYDGTAKLVDFGIARIAGSDTSLVKTGQIVGSLSYMSPEQINSLPIDGRSDIFSTGVMLYEFLTFELPFKGNDAAQTFVRILREDPRPLSDFDLDLPPALQEVINRALSKDVHERYPTAEEFGSELIGIQREMKAATVADSLKRAEAAMQRGDLERVRDHLQEVIRLDRHNDQANRLLREIRQNIQQKQRTSQVGQIRSQAQVALAGAQYEEALACVEQALRLDPNDTQTIELSNQIRNAISRVKAVRVALSRAEAALFAGDLDEAQEAVEESLRLDASDSEARALASMINNELVLRSKKEQVRGFVDLARKGISERDFDNAINALHQAEELDPTDSNVRELLQWAQRGQEQENRRRNLQEITVQIENALRDGDFTSACTISEMGLQRFPGEPTLLRLRSISVRQRDIAERRRFVHDQGLVVKALADQNKLADAVKVLTDALRKYPGEPNLESLLAATRATIDRQKAELEEAARKRAEAEARARLTQTVVDWSNELRRALAAGSPLARVQQNFAQLRLAVEGKQIEDHVREDADRVLSELDAKIRVRDQAVTELEELRRSVEDTADTAELETVETQVLNIKDTFPNEPDVGHLVSNVEGLLSQVREERLVARGRAEAQARAEAVEKAVAEAREASASGREEESLQRLHSALEVYPDERALRTALDSMQKEIARLRAERERREQAERERIAREQAEAEERSRRKAAERAIDEAKKALDQGEGNHALEILQAALERDRANQDLASTLTIIETEVTRRQEEQERLERERQIREQAEAEARARKAAAEQAMGAAHRLLSEDRGEEAIQSLRAALERDPENAELVAALESTQVEITRRLKEQEGLERERQAREQAEAEARARKAAAEQAMGTARRLLSEDRGEEAVQSLRTALERDPENAELVAALDSTQAEVTRRREEQERLEQERLERERQVREQAEAEARARKAAAEQAMGAAHRLLSEGRGEETIQSLRAALERDPENAELVAALESTQVEITRRLKEQEGLERERQAREQAEAEARARKAAAEQAMGTARRLLSEDRGEEAVQSLRTALERDPGNAELKAAIDATDAEVTRRREEQDRLEKKRKEREKRAREQAEAEARARKAAAYKALKGAQSLLAKGHDEEALRKLRSALEQDPKNPELSDAIESAQAEITRKREGQERKEKERQEEAKRACEEAQAEARERKQATEGAIAEGRNLLADGRGEEAIKVLRTALRRDSANAELKAELESASAEVTRRQKEQEHQEKEKRAPQRTEAESRAGQAEAERATAARTDKVDSQNTPDLDPVAATAGAATAVPITSKANERVQNLARRRRTVLIAGVAAVVALAGVRFFAFRVATSTSSQPQITFTTSPADAHLVVDGAAVDCPGSCSLHLEPGNHTATLEKNGYETFTLPFAVSSSKTSQTLALAHSATLTVKSLTTSNPAAAPAELGKTLQRPASPVGPDKPQARVSQQKPQSEPPVPAVPQQTQPTPVASPPIQADLAAWNAVKDQRDLNTLQNFRRNFPASPYARQAYERMDEINWANIHDSTKSEDFKQYLAEFPDGHHAGEANQHIADLQTRARQAEESLARQRQEQHQQQAQEHDREQILQALSAYVGAYESKNLNALAAVWVTAPRKNLERAFKAADRISVKLVPRKFTIDGDSAAVLCYQRIEVTVASQKSVNEAQVLFTMKKQQGNWIIASAE